NREVVNRIPEQEFEFESSTNGFFDGNYWNPAVSVGLQLDWNIFDGFRTRSQVAQNRIERRRAELNREQLRNSIYAELSEALGNLENAYRRIQSQQRNIEQAELNYDIASMRLREGLGTALEERQASSLLDQSQLNYLSAIYDYKVALSAYETALGQALPNL
ncbi:MAG: TolC family protein, partial [Cyclonatronaceae bacterium]